ACHGPLGDEASADAGDAWRSYAPLGPLARKYSIESLAAFLADPLASRPNGLMPDQQLEPMESHALAAFLIEREHAAGHRPGEVAPFRFDPARAVRGAARFANTGCAACHDRTAVSTTPIASALAAPALETLAGDAGCLAATPPAGVPDYAFDQYEREAIAAYLLHAAAGPAAATPLDDLALHLEQLACTACHAYQGALGPGPAVTRLFATDGEADLGDEGRLPPDLTGAGERLTTSWMNAVLADEARARPYLATRMPHFGLATTDALPHLFAAAAGANDGLAEEPVFTTELARHGRTLVGADGLNCIECHRIAGHEATGTPGPDLADMPGRLLPASFRRWVLDPARVRPGTRMPSFFVGGRSAITGILGGDAERQVDAIWAYLSQGASLPLPEGLIDPAGYDLVVGDEPVVFRSFVRDAGVRAIACGFPEQIHCAFDADRCAITMAWEGQFLSAAGAWGARGGSETNPDATAWVAAGPNPLSLAAPETTPDATTTTRFRGYELDAERSPVFLYELRSAGTVVSVRERPRPRRSGAAAGLRRHFELSGPPGVVVIVDTSDPAVSGDRTRVRLDADGRAAFALEVTW
ncbi:MAG: c-type cytochrome, partial [Phycisphaerales bacterium]|nr:c-type cytochrome [Phycisphaerales bacterium]